MTDDILLLAALAGTGLALATGPLGAFVVWRRMAYFGDTIAHAAILGVAISLAFSMSIFVGTLVVSVAVGLMASVLAVRGRTMDATLGVLSHSALALGLVAMSFIRDDAVDLEALLFGDITTVTIGNVVLIWAGSVLLLATLAWRWSSLLTATMNEELAASAGINPARERMVLTVALALVVAMSLKIVGVLLIAALLIVPAAAARGFARSPEAMVVIAILIGAVSVVAGVSAAGVFDTPAGPSIVVAAALIYGVSHLMPLSEM